VLSEVSRSLANGEGIDFGEALRLLARIARIPQASPEYSVALDYINWLCDLPWAASTPDQLNLGPVQELHVLVPDPVVVRPPRSSNARLDGGEIQVDGPRVVGLRAAHIGAHPTRVKGNDGDPF
jgi:hypothetical protein